MGRPSRETGLLDTELDALPPELRWREWMTRVEAVIFAAPEPVTRELLSQIVGRACSIDLLIEDIANELAARPYEIVAVAGGWQFRTRPRQAEVLKAAFGGTTTGADITEGEMLVLASIAYHQPVTRGALSDMLGREVSRDVIGHLRRIDMIASGPRSPQPGAPYTYVTTKKFLEQFGLETLRDLPDLEALEDAGLLSQATIDVPDAPISGTGAEPGS
ncbi:SMC-Scp complex subunit ScpB [Aquamicrobium defluvii]|uniref:Transcriptional regulator n=1 Tax=Aquamicrobium defluvii TaxID=69279 RepID=A0A011TUV5_9HYPH|nr:SMC-Scp complex subunit ScpB [Aquamicrobium defluvii]EXL07917.1 transcriptional regulator [Aquamicrobium defluvii]EZQ14910.1 transcriptional regulator [Halopseudomonas bauzanensis]